MNRIRATLCYETPESTYESTHESYNKSRAQQETALIEKAAAKLNIPNNKSN